ncbi:MAG TPA: GatB/YqeY domain-containing protein [Burkholderiaceae bacterium]|nr:GatB/YqeY domain-containing protein [Burkholderiaceae bacterium]
MNLKERINEDMKAAMRARDAARLSAIRFLQAAIKQKEVDERVVADDAVVLGIIEKLIKQRRDSIAQFEQAGRTDLVDKERAELDLLLQYLPQQMTDAEIDAAIDGALAQVGGAGPQAIGKVMGVLKPQLAGRADMAKVSARVKSKLTG